MFDVSFVKTVRNCIIYEIKGLINISRRLHLCFVKLAFKTNSCIMKQFTINVMYPTPLNPNKIPDCLYTIQLPLS